MLQICSNIPKETRSATSMLIVFLLTLFRSFIVSKTRRAPDSLMKLPRRSSFASVVFTVDKDAFAISNGHAPAFGKSWISLYASDKLCKQEFFERLLHITINPASPSVFPDKSRSLFALVKVESLSVH